MNSVSGRYRKALALLCILVVGIILTAGLWPFVAPKNNVHWLPVGDGLEFGKYGTAISLDLIRTNSENNASETLEIVLKAARSQNNGTILSFAESAHPGEPFSLHQFGNSLVIRRNNVDANGISRTALISVPGLFQKNSQPLFLTIALNAQGMSIYINGRLTNTSLLSGTWNDFTGRVILANSPFFHDSWPGEITRLAVYDREISVDRMGADYSSWKEARRPALGPLDAPVALYLFNEHEGRVAHNSVDAATDLLMPARYFVLHPQFLRTPWREYHPTWGYWEDFFINIAGFIPFGFCICAYLSVMHWTNRPALTTVLLGLLTSLTIELLQVLLPTRSSGMTDLMTNTLGTAVGVMLFRSAVGQTLQMHLRAAIVGTRREKQEVSSRS